MRKIQFEPDRNLPHKGLDAWQRWVNRAVRAKSQLLADWEPNQKRTFDQQIWSDLKDWLLTHVFHGKCAYCETKVSPGAFGDGEHYRPKNRVTVVKDGRRIVVEVSGRPHTGYYWLAYDWINLLPSCQLCNSSKRDHFPVGRTHVCDPSLTSEELDEREDPLLLHPYRDDPTKLFRFGVDGTITSVDDNPRARHTIEVFDLNREALREDRKARQEEAYPLVLNSFIQHHLDGKPMSDLLRTHIGDQAEYCSAVRDYVNDHVIPRLQADLGTIKV